MSEPTPRQVLYALVAGGLLLVVGVLILGAGFAGVVPGWWTMLAAVGWTGITGYVAMRWRKTGVVLGLSIGFFVAWVVVTLLVFTT